MSLGWSFEKITLYMGLHVLILNYIKFMNAKPTFSFLTKHKPINVDD